MGQILDAMRRTFWTRAMPKTVKGQFNALVRREKGDTRRIAERLGVSRRTAQRYVKGERNLANNKKVARRLEREVARDHQPRVTERAERQAQQQGLMVETIATLGFTAPEGSTDDPRVRRMTEDVPDRLVPEVFEAMRTGDEHRLQELFGEALAEEYFRLPGTEAERLDVTFTDIQHFEVDYQ
jgi:predicted transcriptional regulator